MIANDVLKFQLAGSFTMLSERIAALSDAEWTARAFPGTNLLGFILWHTPRTIDWAIHCAIQGAPEVAMGSDWSRLRARDFVYGAGIPQEAADDVAKSVPRAEVAKYVNELRGTALAWLTSQTDADLERIPELQAHQRVNPRYLTEPVWAEVSSLAGRPTWEILARPCISHIRVHIGEIDTLIAAVRAHAGPPLH